NGDILQHFLTTVAKARGFNRCNFYDAAHVVHNQSSQRFAFYVFSHNQQGLGRLSNGFQNRQHFADIGDFLVNQQYERAVQLGRHGVLVVDEVRRQVTAVKLHTFYYVQLVFEAATFFNSDHAFFTNALHGFSDNLANALVAVGRDGAHLSNGFGVAARTGQLFDLINCSVQTFVDTTLQVHRVHARSNRFQTFVHNGLRQNSCSSGTVTGYVVGLGSNYVPRLRDLGFEFVFQLDFLGNGSAGLGVGLSATGLVRSHVTCLRAQSYLDRVPQTIHTGQPSLAGGITVFSVYSWHNRL